MMCLIPDIGIQQEEALEIGSWLVLRLIPIMYIYAADQQI